MEAGGPGDRDPISSRWDAGNCSPRKQQLSGPDLMLEGRGCGG